MSVDFDSMLQDAIGGVGAAVTYTAPLSGPITLNVMPSAQDKVTDFGMTRIQSEAVTFEILVSALPCPKEDAVICYKGKNFKVKKFHKDDVDRLIWFIDCYPL